MPEKLTLYVCHINEGGPRPHACRRAHEALREAGHDYETVVFGRGRMFGLFTTGRRPRLKEMSGQEKLPVLQWPDGTTIAGSGNIVAWAKANSPSAEPEPEPARSTPIGLVEFPADDPERALRFWSGLLGDQLEPRHEGEGAGWQTKSRNPAVGVHLRGRGPGDSFSLPYFAVNDLPKALEEIEALGGSVVHPGESFAICKDSEGSPFGLAAAVSGSTG
jgi:predicted enzyme related to lactoylglutathione lyase